MLKFYLQAIEEKYYLGLLNNEQVSQLLEAEDLLGDQAIVFVKNCLKQKELRLNSIQVQQLVDSIGKTFLSLKIVHQTPKEVLCLDQFFIKSIEQKSDLIIKNDGIKNDNTFSKF